LLTAAATQTQLPYDPIRGVRAGRHGRPRSDAARGIGRRAFQDARGRHRRRAGEAHCDQTMVRPAWVRSRISRPSCSTTQRAFG
jgi:hypothetical protein